MNEVKFALGAATDVGPQRSVNEDFHGFSRTAFGDLYVVCDGMGGHSGGDVASKVATDAIIRYVSNASPESAVTGVISEAILAAHEAVLVAAEAFPPPAPGTTCVVALVQGTHCTIGNIGDSRAYLLRGDSVSMLSTDHSRAQEMANHGIISQEDVANHPEAGVLSQALGQKKELTPAITDISLVEGDSVLLCSDGVYDCLNDAQILELAGVRNPNYAASNIVAYSTEHDGKDNATAIVFRYMEAPGAAPVVAAAPAPAPEPAPAPAAPSGFPLKKVIAIAVVALLAGVAFGKFGLGASGSTAPGRSGEVTPQSKDPAEKPKKRASTNKKKPEAPTAAVQEAPEDEASEEPEGADSEPVSEAPKVPCKSNGDCVKALPCAEKPVCMSGQCQVKKEKPGCCDDHADCRKRGYHWCDKRKNKCDKKHCVSNKGCPPGKTCKKRRGKDKGKCVKKPTSAQSSAPAAADDYPETAKPPTAKAVKPEVAKEPPPSSKPVKPAVAKEPSVNNEKANGNKPQEPPAKDKTVEALESDAAKSRQKLKTQGGR